MSVVHPRLWMVPAVVVVAALGSMHAAAQYVKTIDGLVISPDTASSSSSVGPGPTRSG